MTEFRKAKRPSLGTAFRLSAPDVGCDLLDFRFLESDVLAHDRIILPELKLFSGLAGVLLLHIEEAGASRADQPDENGILFRHNSKSRVRTRCPRIALTR